MNSRKATSLATTLLLFIGLIPLNTFAAASFTGGTNVSGGLNVPVAITDLQVTGAAGGDTVPVFLYVPNGSLSMTTTTGLTFTGASTGQRLYFSGTLTNVNTALATLRYTHSSAGTFTLEASIIGSGQIYDPTTQHIYEVIDHGSNITGGAARAAALARSLNGVNGYLANITSADENNFISARLSQDGWFGASDAEIEGTWKWLDGPEAGTTFWIGTWTGSAQNGSYTNWAGDEPNQSGNEDCSQFYANGSGWNDLGCNGDVSSYVVEYGAPGNLPTVASDTLTITLSADSITQTPVLSSPTSTSRQRILQLTYSLPEVPTAGTVNVAFNDGTTTTTLVMGNSQSVNTTVNLASLITTSGVISTTASSLADGTYTVTLSYQDYLGNPASTALTTVVIIDTTPPIISALDSAPLFPPGSAITWTTNEGATSQVEYGLTTAYGSMTTADNTLDTNHTVNIHHLTGGTTYNYRVITIDAVGNSTIGTNNTFVTGSSGGGVRAGGYSPAPSTPPVTVPAVPGVPVVPVVSVVSGVPVVSVLVNLNSAEEKEKTNNTIPPDSAPETSCDLDYLKNPIKLNARNNPEDVKLLEEFLNTYENANLPVDGVYSKTDYYAVIKWQEKYADTILQPWGLKKGTGYVFRTSLAKIKEIAEAACPKKK